MSNKTILDEAKELVYGDRAAAYGPVIDNFSAIATIAKIEEEVGVIITNALESEFKNKEN